MHLRRLAGLAFATALLVLAGSIALGVLVDLFATPHEQQAVSAQPVAEGGAGLDSFSALAPPTQTPTPLPPPPTEAPVSENAATPAGVTSQPAGPSPVAASDGQATTANYQNYDMAGAVLGYVNSARAAQGLGPLSANGALTSAAESYAQLLAQLNTLSHDLSGGLLARIQASGYAGSNMGEALWEGWGNYSASDIVNDWLNSPHHRAIVLGAYADAGVACYVQEMNGALNTRCVLDVGSP